MIVIAIGIGIVGGVTSFLLFSFVARRGDDSEEEREARREFNYLAQLEYARARRIARLERRHEEVVGYVCPRCGYGQEGCGRAGHDG